MSQRPLAERVDEFPELLRGAVFEGVTAKGVSVTIYFPQKGYKENTGYSVESLGGWLRLESFPSYRLESHRWKVTPTSVVGGTSGISFKILKPAAVKGDGSIWMQIKNNTGPFDKDCVDYGVMDMVRVRVVPVGTDNTRKPTKMPE